jgi:polysaccharide export outer membrane protein
VAVTTFAPRRIYVGGQVKAPGIVEFKGEITPIQAIFDRGGFTTEAQVDSVILIRDAGSPEPIIGRINVNQGLEDGKPERIMLLTNDVLYVPMSGIGRADLWVKQHLNDIVPYGLLGVGAFGAGVGGS